MFFPNIDYVSWRFFSKLNVHQNHEGFLVPPRVSDSVSSGWVQESAFPKSSLVMLVMLMLLARGPHFENHWCRLTCVASNILKFPFSFILSYMTAKQIDLGPHGFTFLYFPGKRTWKLGCNGFGTAENSWEVQQKGLMAVGATGSFKKQPSRLFSTTSLKDTIYLPKGRK